MRYFIINIKSSLLSVAAISVFGMIIPSNSFAGVDPTPNFRKVETVKVVKTVKAPDNQFHNFIKKHNPSLQKNVVDKIAVSVAKYSKETQLDPKLLLALLAKESSFKSNAVSPVGAMGLGQLMRPTANELGVRNPFNIVENIKGTAHYLRKLLNNFNGNIDATLASYNMGPGAVQRSMNRGSKLPHSVYQYVATIKTFKNTI